MAASRGVRWGFAAVLLPFLVYDDLRAAAAANAAKPRQANALYSV